MQDKPVSQIKVTEICQAAEINRATFYSYYTDPMDLLATVEQEVIDNINTVSYTHLPSRFREPGLSLFLSPAVPQAPAVV